MVNFVELLLVNGNNDYYDVTEPINGAKSTTQLVQVQRWTVFTCQYIRSHISNKHNDAFYIILCWSIRTWNWVSYLVSTFKRSMIDMRAEWNKTVGFNGHEWNLSHLRTTSDEKLFLLSVQDQLWCSHLEKTIKICDTVENVFNKIYSSLFLRSRGWL